MRKPAVLPEIGSDAYERLVGRVAYYGWSLGMVLHQPALPSSRATLHAWVKKARQGIEPYASWLPRFLSDVQMEKRKIAERYQCDPIGGSGECGLRGLAGVW